ncbi:MAG: murein biosynthesis integral membrane protein MurJ [Leptolyngbyaceae bacterium]|nr:murein biosynthesis integral membrane protein MurJ [Leptolyngbyaceae bacterium]
MSDSDSKSSPVPVAKRSLANIAGIVAIATLISKFFGLFRQLAIAATFGVGPAANAYAYAYVVPGFLLILLGGINGPFHSAMVSALAKRDKQDTAPLVETMTTLVGAALLIVTLVLVAIAPVIIDLVGPGLADIEKAIAIQQLRIMAPIALLAGLIGIGFGTLNAADLYWLPSISPIFSSAALLVAIGIFAVAMGDTNVTSPNYVMIGGAVLAWGTVAGAVLQWLAQVVAQWRSGLGTLRLRFNWNQPGVRDVLKVMAPATFSSGTLQINVYTDLFFASAIQGAGAALSYANLLVQMPLGIISNMILVPLLPVFSRLAAPEHRDELKARIRQGMILTALTMLPLGALFIVLALPIVRTVYERGAFSSDASALVESILVAYGIGMFVYLGRDVLVRVFYGLGDGATPFRVSVVNIVVNAVLDYLLVQQFGAAGIVYATAGVNLVSMVALLWFLDRKINGLPWRAWSWPILLLTGASAIAGLAAWGTRLGLENWLGTEGLLVHLAQLGGAGFVGLSLFGAIATQLRLPEVDLFTQRIRQKLRR